MRLCAPVNLGQGPSEPSEPSKDLCEGALGADDRADGRRTPQDGSSDQPSASKPLIDKVADGADDVDSKILGLTGGNGADLAEAEI
jgi:hypothetical protein